MDFDFNAFWSYKQNNKAENIRVFFSRVYGFLDDIKEKYKGKKDINCITWWNQYSYKMLF